MYCGVQVECIAIPDIPARAIGLVERQDKRRSLAAVAFLHMLRTHFPHERF